MTLEGGVDLELFEEAGDDAGGGGPGETDLVVDDDGRVDAGADQVLADRVKVGDAGGSGVADGNPEVDKAREGLLQSLDHIVQGLQVLDLALSTSGFPSATPLPPASPTSTRSARTWSAPASTPRSSSTTRSASPGPPPPASSPASSRSS